MNARLLLGLMLLAGCPWFDRELEDDERPEFPVYMCGREAIEIAPMQKSNPGLMPEFAEKDVRACWLLHYDEDPDTLAGPIVVQRVLAPDPHGNVMSCEFRGSANQVRAELTEGGCTASKPTGGFVRFWIDEPIEFQPRGDYGAHLVINGVWAEHRGEDVFRGRAVVRLHNYSRAYDLNSQPEIGLPRHPMMGTIEDLWSGCAAPRCFRVNFAGKGQLVSGDSQTCSGLLANHPTPFDVVINKDGDLAFGRDPATVPAGSWNLGVPRNDQCGMRAFAGQRPSDGRFYAATWDAGGAGEMTMDLTQLYTANNVTDMCRTRWTTTLAACP